MESTEFTEFFEQETRKPGILNKPRMALISRMDEERVPLRVGKLSTHIPCVSTLHALALTSGLGQMSRPALEACSFLLTILPG